MLLQAAKLGVALLAGSGSSSDLNAQEQRVWRKIAPSVVYILQEGLPTGSAALIDQQGLFLASKSLVHSMAVDARTSDGRLIRLSVKATDEPTQLVLLEAPGWNSKESAEIQLGELDPRGRGLPLLAVIGTGPIRADMSWTGNFGVVAPSQRVMPLTEVRFEAPPELIGGALVFNLDGKLVGALNAALQSRDSLTAPTEGVMMKMQRSGGVGGGGGANLLKGDAQPVGPAQLVTAYSLGTNMLRRVIDGFRSPSHEVVHPTIGVYCVNSIGGGALIQGFKEGSTAVKAGLKRGDVIVSIDSKPIRDQIDFSREMLGKSYEQKLKMLIKRGTMTQLVEVAVGK
jgi:S1-C subfamily serine protease